MRCFVIIFFPTFKPSLILAFSNLDSSSLSTTVTETLPLSQRAMPFIAGIFIRKEKCISKRVGTSFAILKIFINSMLILIRMKIGSVYRRTLSSSVFERDRFDFIVVDVRHFLLICQPLSHSPALSVSKVRSFPNRVIMPSSAPHPQLLTFIPFLCRSPISRFVIQCGTGG